MQDIEFTVENNKLGCFKQGLKEYKAAIKIKWTWRKKN